MSSKCNIPGESSLLMSICSVVKISYLLEPPQISYTVKLSRGHHCLIYGRSQHILCYDQIHPCLWYVCERYDCRRASTRSVPAPLGYVSVAAGSHKLQNIPMAGGGIPKHQGHMPESVRSCHQDEIRNITLPPRQWDCSCKRNHHI